MGNLQTVTVAGRVLEVKQQIGEGGKLCHCCLKFVWRAGGVGAGAGSPPPGPSHDAALFFDFGCAPPRWP